MDIAAWLRGLSLERYAEAFRDDAIELEVLPELSEADLEKIGVLLGHRKIMLKAIAELRPPTPQTLAQTAPVVPDAAEVCLRARRLRPPLGVEPRPQPVSRRLGRMPEAPEITSTCERSGPGKVWRAIETALSGLRTQRLVPAG